MENDRQAWSKASRGGGGGTQKSFIRGGSAPRCNSYIPFFSEKAPLSYTFYWRKGTPFIHLLMARLMNKSLKQEVFLSFFLRSG